MSAQPLPEPTLGGGETALFWVLAPIMVIAALGLLFARKAVHAALCIALVMICLAVMYAAQGAQFLFAAQIVVYTGAIMMLFLFVLMLVGVDSADSFKETITGQRWVAVAAGVGMLALFVGVALTLVSGKYGLPAPDPVEANAPANPVGVAVIVFGEYIIAFELVGTLLVTAALGAIMLTHREQLVRPLTQPELQKTRIRSNEHVAGLPNPGVFARHNSIDTPALLPDGSTSEASVQRVLRARDQIRDADTADEDIRSIHDDPHLSGDQS